MAQHTLAQPVASQTGQVTSADGTVIGYRQMGSGPGLVIFHGALTTSKNYLKLAEGLADTFTVYLADRRGRGLSGPQGADYSAAKECEDLAALLRETESRVVFGHSAGGLLALEAALTLPIEKLALYEPPVSIHGSFPTGWIPAFKQAVARKNSARAMALVLKGLQLGGIAGLPLWALSALVRLLLVGDDGREMREQLLPALVQEVGLVYPLDSQYERYRGITAKTLLLGGGKSPAFLREVLPVLAATIPQAQLIEFPTFDHNAPDLNAPGVIATTLKEFFAAEPPPA